MLPLPKTIRVRSRKLRESAYQQPCTLRLPGVCADNRETTVLAHAPEGNKGTALKPSDLWAAFSCYACHDVADGRAPSHLPHSEIDRVWLRAIAETQEYWVREGYITILGFKIAA